MSSREQASEAAASAAEGGRAPPPSDPAEEATDGRRGPDQALLSYAQWVCDLRANQSEKEEALSHKIAAVREAVAVGAAAIVELRSVVQTQLEQLAQHVAWLEQDLAATKLELVEVVIDKETNEVALKGEVDLLRSDIGADVDRTKSFFREVQVAVRESLEQQVVEARQASERDCTELRQMLDAAGQRAEIMCESVATRLEERLEAGRGETIGYFHKIDKVMHHETSGVVQKLENLSHAQSALYTQQESTRCLTERFSDDLRRLMDECAAHARKLQELQREFDARISHLEEHQQSSEARTERMQDQVRDLLASRYSSSDDPAPEYGASRSALIGSAASHGSTTSYSEAATSSRHGGEDLATTSSGGTWGMANATGDSLSSALQPMRRSTASAGSTGAGADVAPAAGAPGGSASKRPSRDTGRAGTMAMALQAPQVLRQAGQPQLLPRQGAGESY